MGRSSTIEAGQEPSPSRKQRPFRSRLERLLAEKGVLPGTYGIFFNTLEGSSLPGSRPGHRIENESGYLVTNKGDHYSYWKDLDPASGKIVLTEFDRVLPEADWAREGEYRHALLRAARSRIPTQT